MRMCCGYLIRLCMLALLAGCGGNSNLPKLMPVTGTVTLDGKPLSGVMLSFVPIGSTHGPVRAAIPTGPARMN